MKENKFIAVIGWCDNDTCGAAIYYGEVKHMDAGEMFCDDCYIEQPVEEL